MFDYLPTYRDAKLKVTDLVRDFFSGDERAQLIANTIKGIPQAFNEQVTPWAQKSGQMSMQGFAGAASGLHSIGQRIQGAIDPTKSYEDYEREYGLTLKPQGTFQQSLYGTSNAITPGSVGREFRSGIGGDDELPIDPALGFFIGFSDAIPGGKQSKDVAKHVAKALESGDEVYANVIKRYGPTIAKKIKELDVPDIMDTALVKGGEKAVYSALNMSELDAVTTELADYFVDFNKARTQLEIQQKLERAKRLAEGKSILESADSAEEGFKGMLGAMKGKLAEADLPGMKLAPEKRELLFNMIRNSPVLTDFERLRASQALGKMLGDEYFKGELPAPNELAQLKKVVGEQLIRNYEDTFAKNAASFGETIAQIANVPRSIMSSADFSAPLRQGLLLSLDNPKKAARAFVEMFKYFGDERYFNAAMDDIVKSPLHGVREAAGLEITDVTGQNFSLGTKEEAFMTDLAQKIPGIGPIVKASERGYSGFLNKLRADVFDDVAEQLMLGGMRPETDLKEFQGVARFINVATGRGELPGKLKGAAPLLNAVFFSPRFLMSRIQMFNPQFYYSLSPTAREMAARSVVKLVSTGIGILALAKMGGAEVSDDPTSSDFGKMKFGDYRYDLWGGFQQPLVAVSKMILGKSTSPSSGKVSELNTDEFGGKTRLDIAANFFRSKLSPVFGSVVDFLKGTNVVGEDVTVQQQLMSRLMPFFFQDLYEAAQEEGLLQAGAKLAPGLFGVGVQRFDSAAGALGLPKLPALPKPPQLPTLPGQ